MFASCIWEWQRASSPESFGSVSATIGGGFLGRLFIGYALKKIAKLAAVVIGLFFTGIAYLQYQQILSINWNKFQSVSQNAVTTLANATMQIPGFNGSDHIAALSILGIPLAGSMSIGRWRKNGDDDIDISFSELQANRDRRHSKLATGQQQKTSLFDNIVGYEDVKELYEMAIKAEKPVHLLLVGPPASAKSLFMSSLSKLERSYYAVGSSSYKIRYIRLLI
jgi:uncharacterized membrane protein (Fun14 family)